MTTLDAGLVPLAVRVKNARYDGMLTGYLHGGVKFNKADPGGFIAASFTVDQRLGFRSDLIQPYSRVSLYNKRNGDTVFEGDVSHPGRSVTTDGSLLEVQVEGGVARLSDWSGPRVYCDSDLTAWERNVATSHSAASVDVGTDRGGSGKDSLFLGLSSETHVETNYRCEAIYRRIAEAGQDLGRINYSWGAGLGTGWLLRLLASAPSVVARSATVNTTGAGISAAYVGPSWTAGADSAFLQFIWMGGSSNTGPTDVTWASVMDLTVVAYLWLKDGTRRAGVDTDDSVKATHVIEDLLGDPEILASTFDGPNAQLDVGGDVDILHLVFPDGVNPMGVLDELMKFEPSCTYMVGPSNRLNDKYTLTWMSRTDDVRYEFITWTDEYSTGAQPVDQYDQVITRWKTPIGNLRFTTATQSIPEMTAVGRHRRFFQDLGDVTGNTTNAANANGTVLNDHRFPQNGGSVTVSRQVVDLYTGRRVQPFEIEPGYLCRIVGINPSRDALNNNPRNGSTLCRIVTTDYDADSHSVNIGLDSEPWSLYRAIANAKPKALPERKSF